MIRRPPRPTRTHSFPTRRSSDLGVRQRQPDHVQLRAGPGLMALFHAHMVVRIPHDIDPDVRADIVAREKAYAQELQESGKWPHRSEEHTSELQSLMRISYAVFCLKKNKHTDQNK